jgi:hypothetical protein
MDLRILVQQKEKVTVMRRKPTNQPTLGQINFDAYRAIMSADKTYGLPLLTWEEASESVRNAWYAAALAVVEKVWEEKHPATK